MKILGLLLMLCLPITNNAQLQRMGVASGVFNLAPRGASSIKTYCLDYTRKAPGAADSYKKVLTSGNTAFVTINGNRKTLQHAIDAGEIAIEGTEVTLSQMMEMITEPTQWNRLSEEDQRRFSELIVQWNNFTPEEKRLLNESFGSIPSHSKMRLVNKTTYDVEVNLQDNIALGATSDETLGSLQMNYIRNAKNDSDQRIVQEELWKRHNKVHQIALKEVGYYQGGIDGIIGPRSKISIQEFQKDNHLDETGVIDGATESALKQRQEDVRENARRIAAINTSVDDIVFLTIERGHNTLYKVYSSSNEPIYIGDDVSEIIRKVEELRRGRSYSAIYFDAKDFHSTTDEQALEITLKNNYKAKGNNDVLVNVLNRKKMPPEIQNLLFETNPRLLEETLTEAHLEKRGNTNFYTSEVRVQFSKSYGWVSSWSTTKATVQTFFTEFRNVFSRQSNVGRAINSAKRNIRRSGVTEQDMFVEFRDQFGGTHIVFITTDRFIVWDN